MKTVFLPLLLCLSLPAGAPDDDSKVRGLVARMEEDDIDVADQAAVDLVKLGPGALPTLRDILRRREGDLRLRLQSVVSKIERAERLRKAMGKPPLVTLRAKDRPLAEVMAELTRQSGVKIEGEELPADRKVSLEAENQLLWKVIDDLCRADGKLMWAYAPKRVVLQAAPYRDLPKVYDRGFLFFLDNFSHNKYPRAGGLQSYCTIQAALVWPPGTTPLTGSFEIQDLEDDKGTNLAPEPQGNRFQRFGRNRFAYSHNQIGDSLYLSLYQNTSAPPADEATALAKFRGRAVLQFAIDSAKVLEVQNPAAQVGIAQTAGAATVLIRSCRRTGAALRLDMDLTTRYGADDRPDEEEEVSFLPWRMVLRDKKGATHSARVEYRGGSSSSGGGQTTETQTLAVTFTLPEGAEADAIEVIRAAEAEEVVIPFEFKAIPID